MSYDGLGRRNVKTITHCGDWDATYHYYYDGQRMVEVHNGSQDVLKQYVWGAMYVDELVQIAINQDPEDTNESLCERFFFALQDANYNVLGMVGVDFYRDTGTLVGADLVERYEYTPYGQRTVYSHGHHIADYNLDGYLNWVTPDWMAWYAENDGQDEEASPADGDGDGDVDNDDYDIANDLYLAGEGQSSYPDTKVMYPRLNSARLADAPTNGGLVSLCDIGHQGLLYDREFGLYYNRARMLSPALGRFMQRDPVGYISGMSLMEYVKSNPQRFCDSRGLQEEDCGCSISSAPKGMKRTHITDIEHIKMILGDGIIKGNFTTNTWEGAKSEALKRLKFLSNFEWEQRVIPRGSWHAVCATCKYVNCKKIEGPFWEDHGMGARIIIDRFEELKGKDIVFKDFLGVNPVIMTVNRYFVTYLREWYRVRTVYYTQQCDRRCYCKRNRAWLTNDEQILSRGSDRFINPYEDSPEHWYSGKGTFSGIEQSEALDNEVDGDPIEIPPPMLVN